MPIPPLVRRVRRTLVAVAMTTGVVLVGVAPAGATNDLRWPQQWGPQKVNAPAAWAVTTGRGVKIGVVDSGIDLGHEDLAGRIATSTTCIDTGGDAGRCTGNGQDDNGHGTHVAGTAAASKDNAKGVAGIAPDAQLVVAKVLDADGGGDLRDVDAGIRWVVDHGAKVVNLSLGEEVSLLTGIFGGSGGSGIKGAIDYAWAKGAIPVIASGNSNEELFGGSANYGEMNAIVVGSSTRSDTIASYSSPIGNAKWGIVAPGGAANGNRDDDIISTYWVAGKTDSYAWSAGTSMATPHVSGAIALLLAQGLSRDAAVTRVLDTANRSVSCGSTCRGRLDLAAATGASPDPGAPAVTAPATTAKPRPTPTTARPASPQPRPIAAPVPAPTPPTPETPETITLTTAAPEPTTSSETAARPEVAAPLPVVPTRDEDDTTIPAGIALAVALGVSALSLRAYSRRRTVTTRP